MPIVSTTKMTAKQFFELGEDPPGVRLELVDGEIAVSPSPIPEHSYTEKMLTIILGQHIRQRKLGRLYGDVDTVFGEFEVRRPDLLYFSKDRVHLVGKKAIEGPPDLCVEILSPSSRLVDRRDKFKQYAAGKVPYYWIVDPAQRTLEGFKLSRGKFRSIGSGKGEEVIRLEPFADLEVPLGDLWQP